MAKKGDWVRIHSIVLKADERTAKLPEDTQKCDPVSYTHLDVYKRQPQENSIS